MKHQHTLFPIVFLLIFFFSSTVFGHAPRENYVWVNVESDHISGRFELNIGDIRNKLGLSIDDASSERSDSDVASTSEEVQQYLSENFQLSDATGEIAYQFTGTGISEEDDKFAQYYFKSQRLPETDSIDITNTIFLNRDQQNFDRLHRSLIVLEYNKNADKDFGKDSPFLVFSRSKPSASLDLVNPSRILEWKDFLKQGVLHIWFGLDHVFYGIDCQKQGMGPHRTI